ncbi:hypothetical protein N4G70_12230 [Streptomyces sp. ASQP_92]|nr:hypothetical protein [Streptomyces sp. ASQP_92]MCT9089640.1 hypothetical protein [Streptomyces sp. ASQP_92]
MKAKLCDDVDSLDGYLPSQLAQLAELARRVAEAREVPEPATT